jgi:hypothetical protein
MVLRLHFSPSTTRAYLDRKFPLAQIYEHTLTRRSLINVLKAANQPVPEELMKFGTTVKKKGHEAYGAFYKDTGDMKAATKITFD